MIVNIFAIIASFGLISTPVDTSTSSKINFNHKIFFNNEASCDISSRSVQSIPLGDQSSQKTWIFLTGLVTDFHLDIKSHALLDKIGQEIGIKIIAVKPPKKSSYYENKLCWPYETLEERKQTFLYIKNIVSVHHVVGYIAFSNGGFFLAKLMEEEELEKPVIMIGAGHDKGSEIQKPLKQNTISIIIGKQDFWNHSLALEFADRAKNDGCIVNLIEHDGGHVLHEDSLKQQIEISK